MSIVPFQKLEKPSEKFDILGNLPNEISYKILIHLTSQDVVNVFKCSKKWYRQMNYAYFWKSKFLKDYDAIDEETENEFYSKFINQFPSPWQGRYFYKSGLKFNFENNNVKHIVSSSRNNGKPIKMVHFDDRRVIFYREKQKELHIADSRSGKIHTVFTHSSAIDRAIQHGELLISLSAFNTILKVWNMKDKKCLVDTSQGFFNRFHESRDSKIIAFKHLIIVINALTTKLWRLYIFDMVGKMMVGYLIDYPDACCNDDLIAMAKEDGSVQIRNTNFTLVDCLRSTGKIFQIIMNNNYLVKVCQEAISECCKAVVWNIKTKTDFIIPDTNNCRLISENKLICSNGIANWELWNLDSQTVHFRFDGNFKQLTWNSSYIFTTVVVPSLDDPHHNVDVKITCITTGRSWVAVRLSSSAQHTIMATEKKLVFSNTNDNKKKRINFSFDIFDYEANIKNPLKQSGKRKEI